MPLDLLTDHLESVGYQRREPVEMVGEFSVRGGILDIFPAEAEHPVRIEMFGDSIESMRRFDPASQRSIFKIEKCPILPLVEWPQNRKLLAEAAAHAQLEFPPAPGDRFPVGNSTFRW